MAVVKTEKRPFGGEVVELKVKCDSEGEFSASLPAFAIATLGYNIVTAKSLEEAIKKWSKAGADYTSTQTKCEKVILYLVSANAYIWDDKADKLIHNYQDRAHSREGISLSVIATVANEFQLTLPDGKVRYRYEEVESGLPKSMDEFSHFNYWNHGDQEKHRLIWTQEREDFFTKIGRAMESVIIQLKQLDDPVRALAIADTGRLLEFKK